MYQISIKNAARRQAIPMVRKSVIVPSDTLLLYFVFIVNQNEVEFKRKSKINKFNKREKRNGLMLDLKFIWTTRYC